MLDKIYFYNDRFGLAFDKNTLRYGFIDKELNTKIEFHYREAEIAQLKDLQSIDLSSNNFTALPTEIAQLRNLHSFALFDNQLTALPAEIRNLSRLKYLYLQGNPFPAEYIEQLRKDIPWCDVWWLTPEKKD